MITLKPLMPLHRALSVDTLFHVFVFLLLTSVVGAQVESVHALSAVEVKHDHVLDSSFLIVKIVDFRKVVVGTTKDSVVNAMIQNPSSFPARVDSIVIIGNNSPNFSVLAESYPFVVQPRSTHTSAFRFKPLTLGLKDVALRVYASGIAFWGALAGEGVNPVVSLPNPLIDFGGVPTGQWRDSLVSVTIKNVSNNALTITRTWHGGPDSLSFSTIKGAGPFTLKPGESHAMTLRFTPRIIGPVSGSLLFEFNGVGSPAVVQLLGTGLGNRIIISTDSAAVGEHRTITLRLLDSLPSQPIPMKFRAHVSSPVANYFPSNVSHLNLSGESIAFDVEGDWPGTSQVIDSFDVEAVLASRQTSPLQLDSFVWLDTAGNALPYQTSAQNGSFTLTNLCTAGGTRLVNASGSISLAMIHPHPIEGDQASVEFQTSEDSPTRIELVDLNGLSVLTIINGVLPPGTHSISVDLHSVPNGTYLLRMRTRTESLSETVVLFR